MRDCRRQQQYHFRDLSAMYPDRSTFAHRLLHDDSTAFQRAQQDHGNRPATMANHLSFQSATTITARVMMSVLFVASGTSKLTAPDFTKKYMEAYGVPGYLLYPAAALEITCGTMLILGVMLTPLGLLLTGWCILCASIFHRDWNGDNGQTEQIMFMKNLCMAGGFLMLAAGQQGSSSAGEYWERLYGNVS